MFGAEVKKARVRSYSKGLFIQPKVVQEQTIHTSPLNRAGGASRTFARDGRPSDFHPHSQILSFGFIHVNQPWVLGWNLTVLCYLPERFQFHQ